MKAYKIKAKIVFEGSFLVKAEHFEEARRIVEKECGCTLSNGISSLNSNVDWDFDPHAEIKLVR